MPIPLASLVATTLATFAARRSLGSRRLEAVAGDGFAGPEPAPAADEGWRNEPRGGMRGVWPACRRRRWPAAPATS